MIVHIGRDYYSWDGYKVESYRVLDVKPRKGIVLIKKTSGDMMSPRSGTVTFVNYLGDKEIWSCGDKEVSNSIEDKHLVCYDSISTLEESLYNNLVDTNRSSKGLQCSTDYFSFDDIMSICKDESAIVQRRFYNKLLELREKRGLFTVNWSKASSVFELGREFFIIRNNEVISCKVFNINLDVPDIYNCELDSGSIEKKSALVVTFRVVDGTVFIMESLSQLGSVVFYSKEDALQMLNFRKAFQKF